MTTSWANGKLELKTSASRQLFSGAQGVLTWNFTPGAEGVEVEAHTVDPKTGRLLKGELSVAHEQMQVRSYAVCCLGLGSGSGLGLRLGLGLRPGQVPADARRVGGTAPSPPLFGHPACCLCSHPLADHPIHHSFDDYSPPQLICTF